MKKFFRYLTNSQLDIAIIMNPRQWDLYVEYKTGSTMMDPGMLYNLELQILMVKINIVIDDGSY